MPSTIDRTTILKGPAYASWNSIFIHFAADLTVDFITEYFDVPSSSFGRVKSRVKNRRIEINGTPIMWSDMASLWPYATKNIGDVIFGGTDLPMVITPRNGKPLTIANVAVTQLAGIILSAVKSMLKPMKFVGLCANASDPGAAASYYSLGTLGTNVAQSNLDLTKIVNAVYSAAFHGLTFRSEGGFDIDFPMSLDAENGDGDPTTNYRITSLEASCKVTPFGMTEANYAALLGWDGIPIGGDPFAGSLVITGGVTGQPSITLANMTAKPGKHQYGGAALRTGEVMLESIRTITSGNLNALWTFGTVA